MISVGIILLDQGLKSLVRKTEPGSILAEISGVISVSHTVNSGAAFSMFSGQTIGIAVLSMILMTALCMYAYKNLHLTAPAKVALSCMIGGGIGNLIDRIVYQGVTDYIKLLWIDFPVFNLADIAITVSVAAMFILLIIGRFEESTGENNGTID